jgi:hypothetical protein
MFKRRASPSNWANGFTPAVVVCHSTKWVKVGEYMVLCSKLGEYEEHLKEVDVFFGLDDIYFTRCKLKVINTPQIVEVVGSIVIDGSVKIVPVQIEDGTISHQIGEMVKKAILSGMKVGFGCMGGHGRTGWLLGYLLHHIEGIPKGDGLVREVRKRLCDRAIESVAQITDLGGTVVVPLLERRWWDYGEF